jgi:hypothetical protein
MKLVYGPKKLKFNPPAVDDSNMRAAASSLMEKRFQATEVRAVKGKRTIAGYAARYSVLSNPIPAGDGQTFRERIEPGAFTRILASNPDCVCLFNHDDHKVLGRTTSGTLRLQEDARGLKFECDLPDTQVGRETYELVQRSDLNGCSFAFMVDDRNMCSYREEDIEAEEEDGFRGRVQRTIRTIVRSIRDFANLIDVSVVTHPAYPNTSVDSRVLSVVGAEARSSVAAMKQPSPSIAERVDDVKAESAFDVRKRRLAILDL